MAELKVEKLYELGMWLYSMGVCSLDKAEYIRGWLEGTYNLHSSTPLRTVLIPSTIKTDVYSFARVTNYTDSFYMEEFVPSGLKVDYYVTMRRHVFQEQTFPFPRQLTLYFGTTQDGTYAAIGIGKVDYVR